MARSAGTIFVAHVKRTLSPELEGHGFTEIGRLEWNRVVDGVAQKIWLSRSKYGGEYTVDLGIHPLWATEHDPDFQERHPEQRKLGMMSGGRWLHVGFEPADQHTGPWPHERPHLLELNTDPGVFVPPPATRGSWEFKTPKRTVADDNFLAPLRELPDPVDAADELTRDVREHAVPFLERYRSLERIVADTPVAALASRSRLDAEHIPWGIDPAPGALLMSRIELHLGNFESALAYARFGLGLDEPKPDLESSLELAARVASEALAAAD